MNEALQWAAICLLGLGLLAVASGWDFPRRPPPRHHQGDRWPFNQKGDH